MSKKYEDLTPQEREEWHQQFIKIIKGMPGTALDEIKALRFALYCQIMSLSNYL